jgi:hypothetical protein
LITKTPKLSNPEDKGVFNVSSLSTRGRSDGSSNAQEEMAQKFEKRASLLLQEDHLNWPNNHKPVAHNINTEKITRFTIRPRH